MSKLATIITVLRPGLRFLKHFRFFVRGGLIITSRTRDNMLWKSTGQEHYAHTRSAEQKTALLCTGAGTNQHDAYMKYMNALPHD